MSNSKISALTSATTPLAGTEVLPIVQSGITKQVSVANLTAGRSVSASDVTASTGNFIVGTSGKGIDFSATPGTGTSELLADYEEGTWTPVFQTSGGGLSVGYSVNSGRYTKIGNQVTVWGNIQLSSKSASGSGYLQVAALPFTVLSSGMAETGGSVGISYLWASNACQTILPAVNTTTAALNYNFTNASCSGADLGSSSYFRFTFTYQTA